MRMGRIESYGGKRDPLEGEVPLALDYSPVKETKAEQRAKSVLAEGTKSTSQLSAKGTYGETYD